MEYRWQKRTQSFPRGHVQALDPNSPHTRELLARGIIAPEAKVLEVPEVKAKPRRKRKAKPDE